MSDLLRYGLQWNGPRNFVCTPMDDGFWTPWQEAAEECNELRQRAELAEANVETLNECFANQQADCVKWVVRGDNAEKDLLAAQSTIAELREAVSVGIYWVEIFAGSDDELAQAGLSRMRAVLGKGE